VSEGISSDTRCAGLVEIIDPVLDNAFRHGAPPVSVSITRAEGRLRLAVQDKGPGLPSGSEERLFDRFYRADPARSGDGTGLGLSIARAIAEAHGGTIRATNAEGGGAIVTLELPAL